MLVSTMVCNIKKAKTDLGLLNLSQTSWPCQEKILISNTAQEV